MVLLEALAHGKPIVATDCPTGPREILDDGRAACSCRSATSDAMADALARIVTDALLRDTMSCERTGARAALWNRAEQPAFRRVCQRCSRGAAKSRGRIVGQRAV